jgi:hypothetical protein
MSSYPYESFKEWEQDMERFRAHPQDVHLIKHIRSRVQASSEGLQKQVHEYLQDMAFASNPVPIGNMLAKKYSKLFFIRSSDDPWFYV